MARTAGSHSALTAPRIREAAQALFAQHGYAAVSMRQIAAEVGVQVGALYNYTSDKQSLLFDLMSSHLDDLLSARAEDQTEADPMQALEQFTRFHIRFHARRPDAVFIAYMELRNLTPENFATIEAMRRRYEDGLSAILRDGQAQGAFRIQDARVATMAIIAMLTGVNTWFRKTGRLSLSEVEEIYWDMMRRLVVA
ncbi:TetR/AcrR family transcriptional regulator [Pseudooceanicola sp.]|uniref:TetR/AcrR family transcriptional regulator n=1 Tax=Pseudooceanicola sp. TaxID=1914328 RepID=UPI004058D831|tara:strand:+ start:4463 stop:5050 length:588 start_codon:yes stop_codon:yes gene_type:complete